MAIIYQLGLWGDDNAILVPKDPSDELTDWVRVALAGWKKGWLKWLNFWGLARVRKVRQFSNGHDETLAMSVPEPVETMALQNLSDEARKIVYAQGIIRLTDIDRILIALARHYMQNYFKRDFQLKYHQFISQYIPDTLEETHCYRWIAHQLDMYTSEAQDADKLKIVRKALAWREVVNLLDVASVRLELMQDQGLQPRLDMDISHVLKVKRRKAA